MTTLLRVEVISQHAVVEQTPGTVLEIEFLSLSLLNRSVDVLRRTTVLNLVVS